MLCGPRIPASSLDSTYFSFSLTATLYLRFWLVAERNQGRVSDCENKKEIRNVDLPVLDLERIFPRKF